MLTATPIYVVSTLTQQILALLALDSVRILTGNFG